MSRAAPEPAAETDIADFEWARAEAKAKRGLESLKETSDYFDLHAGEWTKKQQKLDEYKALALKLMKWPPTSVAANSLLESIRAINDRLRRAAAKRRPCVKRRPIRRRRLLTCCTRSIPSSRKTGLTTP